MRKDLGTDLGAWLAVAMRGFPKDQPRCRALIRMVELQRGEQTLSFLSRCEVSLNTVALLDLGLVSSSRFKGRMLTLEPTPPPHYLNIRDSLVSLGADKAVAPLVCNEPSLLFSQRQMYPSGRLNRKLFSPTRPIHPNFVIQRSSCQVAYVCL